MKPCTGCCYLNAKYYKGSICHRGMSASKKDQYTGRQSVQVMWVEDARAEGGICGPDRTLYFPRVFSFAFLALIWKRVTEAYR